MPVGVEKVRQENVFSRLRVSREVFLLSVWLTGCYGECGGLAEEPHQSLEVLRSRR